MKTKLTSILLLLCIAISAQAQNSKVIELHLQKKPTTESLSPLAMPWQEENNSEFSKIYPPLKNMPDWTDLQIFQNILNSRQALYYLHKSCKVTDEFYNEYFNAWGVDTVGYTAEPMHIYIRMVTGKNKDGEQLFIFDENGNNDLADDRVFTHLDSMPVIPLRIERYIGGTIQSDTLFVKTVNLHSMYLLKSYEKTETEFTDDTKTTWQVEVYPSVDIYGAGASIRIGKKGDSLLSYPLNGIVEINNTFFRIDSLRPDGRYLRLSEEPKNIQAEALQKGFRPFSFTTQTIDGETINFPNDFQGKYVLLDFWSTSCRPCIEEIKAYFTPAYEMYKEYDFEIVSVADNTKEEIEHFIRETPIPWIQIVDREQDRVIQKQYNIVKYPTVFLLDKTGNIVAIDREIRGALLLKKLQELISEARTSISVTDENNNK